MLKEPAFHPFEQEAKDLYPSRYIDSPRVTPRKDPVVYGKPGEGPLSAGQLEFYDRNGYLTFDNLFSERELERYQRELASLNDNPLVREREETVVEPYSGDVRSIFAVHEISNVIRKLCTDVRVVRIAEQILGSQVYFHQTRINYKPGFGGHGFYWHSDFETWHAEDGMPNMRAVSCSISLTPNTEYNGPLMVIPGSHRDFIGCVGRTPEQNYKESLKNQEFGTPDPDSLQRLYKRGGIVSPTGSMGLVTFFDCNLMHGSNSNITPLPRSNVFMVFNSIENQPVEPFEAPAPRPEFIGKRSGIRPIEAIQADPDEQ
ncbi:MAG: ectoine hydroxylase [Gammaproteobacteria bacterium]|nr:ectoine hydroxylase [Gammaproteobacteria bacterium]